VTLAGTSPSGSRSPFQEASADPAPAAVPLSHVSIELGHLYFDDFRTGPDRLLRHFREVAPWVQAARSALGAEMGAALPAGRRPRISTCFLLDDYFGPTLAPSEVLAPVLAAAEEAGVPIDYVARESACAQADGVPLAELVQARIVADPAPGTNGSRPPVHETGWLSNGQRSPDPGEAMGSLRPWTPPSENGTARHSVFVDVELRGNGKWSCAYLAAIWQLLRLGLLRAEGSAVAQPQDRPEHLARDWSRLPAVIRINPRAAPFSAYRTLSVRGGRFLPTELAVRTVLNQFAADPIVNDGVVARAAAEGLELPPETVDRVRYIFL
jgi:hypothetical protein